MKYTAPVHCDLRNASDTPEERAAEYQQLFTTALCGRDKTDRMVRFRLRRAAVDEDQVRRLAAREQACCPFFDIHLKTVGEELWWETRIDGNPEAAVMLQEFHRLPDLLASPASEVENLVERGLLITHERGSQETSPKPSRKRATRRPDVGRHLVEDVAARERPSC